MIVRTLVKEEDRMDFLPKHLNNYFFMYENYVYDLMRHYCKDYTGGFWDFYELSNGGMYMSFDSNEPIRAVNYLNQFDDTMSPDAASIAINMFALYALIEKSQIEHYSNLYYKLKDFGMEHKEADKIYWLID